MTGPRAESPPEMELFRRLMEWGMPTPERQVKIFDDAGCFVARVDIADVVRKLVYEYDGEERHGPRQAVLDDERQRRIEALGWRVERVGKEDLRRPATALRRRLERLLLSDSAA